MDFWDEDGTGIDPVTEANRTIFGDEGLPVTGWMLSIFNTNDNATNHTTINAYKYTRHDD